MHTASLAREYIYVYQLTKQLLQRVSSSLLMTSTIVLLLTRGTGAAGLGLFLLIAVPAGFWRLLLLEQVASKLRPVHNVHG